LWRLRFTADQAQPVEPLVLAQSNAVAILIAPGLECD
jgi:hypothetical protein